MSQLNHVGITGPKGHAPQRHLVEENYITWSLIAGFYPNKTVTDFQVTKEKHLEKAKEILSGFDHLFDFGFMDKICQNRVLKLLQFKDKKMTHLKNSKKRNYTSNFKSDYLKHLVEVNSVDIELYKYAKRLMEADCEFLSQVNITKKYEYNSDIFWEKINEGGLSSKLL